MVMTTAAEIVGIRLEDKAPHSRLVGSTKHDKRRLWRLKMKRIISLALILVLTLICGVQIAADSAETRLMCKHVFSSTLVGEEEQDTTPHNECHYRVYNREVFHCTLCGYSYEGERSYVGEVWHHVVPEGQTRCIYCWGVPSNS